MDSFVDTMNRVAKPSVLWEKLVAFKQVGDAEPSAPGRGQEEYRVIGGGENSFPHEYSVGGWFKWSGAYDGWHTIFRLTINNKPENLDAAR